MSERIGKYDGTITRNLGEAFDGLQDEFRNLYDIDDFMTKLRELERAWKHEDRGIRLQQLYNMLDRYNISYEKDKDLSYYRRLVDIADIPHFDYIENKMLEAVYRIFEKFPSPEEYLQRMVDRLCFAEDHWKSDTLRLRILKQFIKYGDYLKYAVTENGKRIYEGDRKIIRYVKEKLGKKTCSTEEVLQFIDDGVFDIYINELEAAKDELILARDRQSELVRLRADNTDTDDDLDKKIAENKKRISALKDRCKEIRKRYGLLKLSDDLAEGKFRIEGATKRGLYMFAIVFNMTYYSGDAMTSFCDPMTDIEKNLFRDYYTNNLIRYISEEYKGNITEYEQDPSGLGINYKNFEEIVYLYYISGNLSPAEKLKHSFEMINRIIIKHKELADAGELSEMCENTDTAIHMNYIFNDRILLLPENDFEEYIIHHFNCKPYHAGTRIGNLQVETEQKTAFKEYKKIIKDLCSLLKKNDASKKEIKDKDLLLECRYGLWFKDVESLKLQYRNGIINQDNMNPQKYSELLDLLEGLNSFLGSGTARTKALDIESAEKITRTALLVAYYYYFNECHFQDKDNKNTSFEVVFNSFKSEIDEKLAASHYQLLNSRNLIDLLITFSSYAYINN